RKLYTFKDSFGFFANHLTWPEKRDFHPDEVTEAFGPGHPARNHVLRYWEEIHRFSLDGLREMYTSTFDFEEDCALYMTWFKFEDARERGQMLAKLKVLYEMYGLEMPDEE